MSVENISVYTVFNDDGRAVAHTFGIRTMCKAVLCGGCLQQIHFGDQGLTVGKVFRKLSEHCRTQHPDAFPGMTSEVFASKLGFTSTRGEIPGYLAPGIVMTRETLDVLLSQRLEAIQTKEPDTLAKDGNPCSACFAPPAGSCHPQKGGKDTTRCICHTPNCRM